MFVTHIFATKPDLPPIPAGLYQYVVAANGIFVRAKRPGLEAQIWVAGTAEKIRGLVEIQPYVKLGKPVPRYMLEHLFLDAWRKRPNEALYYLKHIEPAQAAAFWAASMPSQIQSPGGVRPSDPYSSGTDTLLELHSHHSMAAYFSQTDNRDERYGFRLFAVVGRLDQARPEIRVRVGIYGHFWEVPAGWVFEMPPFAKDATVPEEVSEVVYEDIAE
jgi:PRTRC genetic system protein A